ncbi:hypothetical protein BGZ54_002022 [Gamsiella multidivaricata]|nr:hypothetical protein BGZ54_002022 [Gamsiella multidivaricata]
MIETGTSSAASLRFLLLGDVGVGKTTFVNTFASTLSSVLSSTPVEEFIPTPNTSATTTPPAIRLPGVRIQTEPVLVNNTEMSPSDDPLNLLPPKVSIPSRDLTFVTLPGYSSTINPSTTLSMTDDYLNHHLHTVTSIFSPAVSSAQLAWFLIAGSGAHSLPACAFYFVLYELKPIDILYMKMIHERVNLIPVIAKADTLSKNELWVLKKRMLRQLKLNDIKIHAFGSDMEAIEQMTKDRQWGAPPFAISTRLDSDGQLLQSELKQLVNLCLYERVRHLQEDAARKAIGWKKAFGNSGNPTKTNVEKIWSERDVVKAGAANGTISSSSFVDSTTHNPYFAHIDTRPTEVTPASLVSPTPYTTATPVQQQVQSAVFPLQQQQQQPFTPPTPAVSQFSTSYAMSTASVPFTPPPSSVNSAINTPTTFGLPPTGYAPPPSFSNTAPAGYTAPPSTFNKPAPVMTYPTPGISAATPNGLISPPPSASQQTSYVASTAYSPPPRTTSAGTVGTGAAAITQTRVPLTHTSSGMSVDSSTRPSEIMDAHKQDGMLRQSFMENYVVSNATPGSAAAVGAGDHNNVSPPPGALSSTSSNPDANEFKVEIPNSGTSYQPSASETTLDLSSTLATSSQMQSQGSFLLSGAGFHQTPGAFLIPPPDLYQAAMITSSAAAVAATGAVATNEYGDPVPDIWEAAELGDVATVQMHLNNGVSPDQRNNSRSTLLHRTAWQGVKPYAVMKLLISYGANVNLTNENGNTVLQNVLMKHDDPGLIKLLLDNGAEAMIPNKEGMNTLEVAALFNKLESARYLLENDLSSSEPQSIVAALQRARSPDKKAMKALLKSWQGKDGERRRMELMERLRSPHPHPQAPPVPSSDTASVKSFETTKGDGKSSKWRKLKF